MFGALLGALSRVPEKADRPTATAVGEFAVNVDAGDSEAEIHRTEPQLFCEIHRTPNGGVLFSEPAESDRWISAARTVEVEP